MKRKGLLFVVVLLLCLVLTGVAIAWDQSEASVAVSARPARLRHCITQVEVVTAEAGEASEESLAVEEGVGAAATCFATFGEAVSAATNGAIRLAPDITAATLTEEMLQSESPTAVIIGIDYDGFNSTGATLTFYAPNAVGCTTGLSYAKNIAPSGWNDRVSSAGAGFVGCNRMYHYEGTFATGAVLRCPAPGNTCAVFGAMNNHTSSWRFYGGGFHY